MARNPLEPQNLYFSSGAEVPIEVKVYASQYASGASVPWRFQLFSASAPTVIYIDDTGTGVVASGEFTVTLSTVDTASTPASEDLNPDYHEWLMWDTNLDREIAFGYAFVKEGLR